MKELREMMEDARQTKLLKGINLLTRIAVQNTVYEKDLDMIGSGAATSSNAQVTAAARLKKQGLLFGVIDPEHSGSTPRLHSQPGHGRRQDSHHPPLMQQRYSESVLSEMRCSTSKLVLPSAVDPYRATRFLAQYDRIPVLLEFKNDTGLPPEVLKDRMCKVSAFLQDLDASFHGRSCIGYVKVHNRYAYVFDLRELHPNIINAAAPPTKYCTVQRLLEEEPRPSLNVRFSFAVTLLETLVQLHTSGWLHKEFRSENIVFFLSSTEQRQNPVSGDMRILGYAYARADRPDEATEPLRSEQEADLYRHPATTQPKRVPYQKAFDMFSVACVLLELGMWCSWPKHLRRLSDQAQASRAALKDVFVMRQETLFGEVGVLGSRLAELSLSRAGASDGRAQIWGDLSATMGKTYCQVTRQLMYAADSVNSAALQ